MGVTSSADLTRDPVAIHDWGVAYARLSAADHDRSLEAAELVQLATSAYLTGREDECYQASERAHLEYPRQGETTQAFRCAFWLALPLLLKGDMARGAGWIARAQRLIDEQQLDCVERGYLLIPGGIR